MQTNARIAAAIEILDAILKGDAAERALTTWARTHRFAGSGDRASIRDLVFDALRRKRSYAWQGGACTGRGLMVGAFKAASDLDSIFTGDGYAPPALSKAERLAIRGLEEAPDAVQLDCPDWLLPRLRNAYPDTSDAILRQLRDRAPVFLRVNRTKASRETAQAMLSKEDIGTRVHALSDSALEVTGNARRLRSTRAFLDGFVELQDAASQAVVDACLSVTAEGRVLDYCAGGGGKALALAAAGLEVTAHDANPARMSDLPARIERSGTPIVITEAVAGHFDLVLCDAPCSGSGAWRRQPEGKWALDPARLTDLKALQDQILDMAQLHVRPGGVLAYATCSLLPEENTERAGAFLRRNPSWLELFQRQWTPLDGGDGFFLSLFRKS